MKKNSELMALPLQVVDAMQENEMLLVVGGNTGLDLSATNNADGICDGTNNSSGTCGGTNNGSGRCGVTDVTTLLNHNVIIYC